MALRQQLSALKRMAKRTLRRGLMRRLGTVLSEAWALARGGGDLGESDSAGPSKGGTSSKRRMVTRRVLAAVKEQREQRRRRRAMKILATKSLEARCRDHGGCVGLPSKVEVPSSVSSQMAWPLTLLFIWCLSWTPPQSTFHQVILDPETPNERTASLPPSAQGVVFLNIDSFMGGGMMWRLARMRQQREKEKQAGPSGVSDIANSSGSGAIGGASGATFGASSCDGVLEVRL